MADQPIAIVTGSSRGIGRAIAIALGRAGYAVVVNAARHLAAAEEVAHEIESAGGRAVAVLASVAEAAGREQLLAVARDQLGEVQVLVNNAGITSPGRLDLLDATEDNWDLVFATNLKGPFFLTQQTARHMIAARQAGRIDHATIVNISSISAFAVSTNRGDYCLTKSAQQMMTQLFATRLAEYGIRVYDVCPGIIATDMTSAVRDKYDQLIAEGLTPMPRWGQPEDVARTVLALVRGDFPFSTGERIHVDGGFHIRRL
jgi:NAD(P)-dependent dehydrogenase (short-subunit alcohol dehydrogenase family)